MHWADVVAVNLSKKATSISFPPELPQAENFTLAILREILTGEMISRAAIDAGLEVEFIFIVDDADPLREFTHF